MKKKQSNFIGIGLAVALITAMIYWFYFSTPTSFPTNNQLVGEINSNFPGVDASFIQDRIPVDEHHMLVPFISNQDDYGLSYWVWQKHKWRAATIDTKGQPMVWKIDSSNPSSYRIVWNIHPDDQLSSIHFYFIRDRGFHISEGIDHYYPRIQMEEEISLDEKPYGTMQLPIEWATIMNTFKQVESVNGVRFHWHPIDQADKETFPKHSVNGSGYSNGNVDLEYVSIMDNDDIELP